MSLGPLRMAAFIVVDPDESSYLEQPSYLDRGDRGAGGANNVFRMPMPVI